MTGAGDRHLLLSGPPGVGKSTVGPLVAARLGRPFLDTDQRIAAAAGRSVPELFRAEGEAAFRARERACLAELLAAPEPAVVALGGGTLVDAASRDLALRQALVLSLNAPEATLWARLSGAPGARPLIDSSDALTGLLRARAAVYRAAHLMLDAQAPAETIARSIVARVRAGVVPLVTASEAYAAWVLEPVEGVEEPARALAEVCSGIAPSSVFSAVDRAVLDLFGRDLLERAGLAPHAVIAVGPGEDAKTLRSLEALLEALVGAGADRETLLVALGGGATSDVAGLAAGLLHRGAPWVAVPTTLLSMVDASIGGKTAVNLATVKNPIGLFHHPRAVLVAPGLAASESGRSHRAALAEVVKCALIGDAALFEELERGPAAFLGREPAALRRAIFGCLTLKAAIVQADPTERGARAVLNLGHTFGHAFEAASGGGLLHGEAIAMGLEVALEVGVRLGLTPPLVRDRAVAVLRSLELPGAPPLSGGIREKIGFDKKRHGPTVQFVVARDIGRAEVVPVGLSTLTSFG